MARLYSTENFPLPAVEKLRALGHDVLTVQETGKADQSLPDDKVLEFAAAENRAVLTLNRRHFIACIGKIPGTPASSSAPLMRILRDRRSGFIKPSAVKRRWPDN